MKVTIELYLVVEKKRVFMGEVNLQAEIRNAVAIGLEGSRKLTKRQTEVRDLILAGKVHKEIATAMNLTESSVKQHAGNIYRKYGVRDRAALVATIY